MLRTPCRKAGVAQVQSEIFHQKLSELNLPLFTFCVRKSLALHFRDIEPLSVSIQIRCKGLWQNAGVCLAGDGYGLFLLSSGNRHGLLLLQQNAIAGQYFKFTSSSKPFLSPKKHTCAYNTHSRAHAQLRSITPTYSSHLSTPRLEPSLCYWKCGAATGANSWRIYMTQVHTLESARHACTLATACTSGGTWMGQAAKTSSNVSHLMSTPLTSHNTLQTYTNTHTHIHTHMCLDGLDQCKPGWGFHPAPLVSATWFNVFA